MTEITPIEKEQVWPVRHQVMYPDKDFNDIKLAEDHLAEHFGLFVNKRLMSVVSLFQQNDDIQFRKFATISEAQGKGLGSKLLQHIIHHSQQKGAKRMWCNARTSASAFYAKFGFVPTDKTYFADGYDFLIMEKYL